jgi:hypothetical protein
VPGKAIWGGFPVRPVRLWPTCGSDIVPGHVPPRKLIVPLALAAALLAAGCGGGGLKQSRIERQVKETGNSNPLGFPIFATKNTTRVPGSDAVEDAAAVARAAYPGFDAGQRPDAVTFVDERDWPAAIAAAALMAPPVRAPVLLTSGDTVPGVTADTVKALRPPGTALANRAQAFRIGRAGVAGVARTLSVTGRDPFTLAAAVDSLAFRLTGRRSSAVVVAPVSDPRFAMPAAAWAAKSGDAVLFSGLASLPAATRLAIERRDNPSIYVLGPPSVISDSVLATLRGLGRVRRIGAATPVDNAIAFARYSDGTFGWGIEDPGHGLVVANERRPLDAAAAAALSGSGTYGPLLLTDSATMLAPALRNYLLDIQPGYQTDPVRGVYNHAWLMGDESAVSASAQATIDELTEIVRVKAGQPQ